MDDSKETKGNLNKGQWKHTALLYYNHTIAPKVFLFNDGTQTSLSLSLSSGSVMEGPEASAMDSFVHQVSMHCYRGVEVCVCP